MTRMTGALSRGVLSLTLAWGVAQGAQAVEILRWDRVPLAVPLQVGQERIVFIDQHVRVGVPNTLKEALRVQSANGALYLKADQPIEPTRLQLQSASTGELILIDIAATRAAQGAAPLEPIKIVRGERAPSTYGATDTSEPDSDEADDEEQDIASQPPVRETPIPVVLTRHAAQSLYAPLRTVEPVDGISPVNLAPGLNLSGLLPSQPVRASALAAWRLDDYWVTAVKLQNLSANRLALDPRELQGDLATATFQHATLGNRGDPADTTVVYLVTQGRDLAQSVLPALSQVDATLNQGDAP